MTAGEPQLSLSTCEHAAAPRRQKTGKKSTAIWNNSNSEYFNQLLKGVVPHASQPSNTTANAGSVR
jgi:hypothetical protein